MPLRHLSLKIQDVEFYSTSFLGLENVWILGRITECRIQQRRMEFDVLYIEST